MIQVLASKVYRSLVSQSTTSTLEGYQASLGSPCTMGAQRSQSYQTGAARAQACVQVLAGLQVHSAAVRGGS